MTDYYTENLAEFGIREIRMLHDILDAWIRNGLPNDFSDNAVRPAFNKNSGNVFLVNDDCEVAMMNGERLEAFYSLPDGGAEGFLSDLVTELTPDDLHPDDVEYVLDIAERNAFDLAPPWLDVKIDSILTDE